MNAPRVGLVGARRARQGLGPFVAKFLSAAGLELPCFLGTRPASLALAAEELAARAGVRARGYTELETLLAREELDALAILSPPETHERYLEAALAAGLHVLCEKPLLAGGPDPAGRAARLVDAFAARGLLLAENCQWPAVLPAFARGAPGTLDAPLERFAMRLSPASRGRAMLVDSLSHPLSVLQALAPGDDARVRDARCVARAEEAELSFHYRAGARDVAARVELSRGESLPRPAWLSINGVRAERLVRLPEYAIVLRFETGDVQVRDPLEVHLESFAGALRSVLAGATPPPTRALARRQQMLETLLDAHRKAVP